MGLEPPDRVRAVVHGGHEMDRRAEVSEKSWKCHFKESQRMFPPEGIAERRREAEENECRTCRDKACVDKPRARLRDGHKDAVSFLSRVVLLYSRSVSRSPFPYPYLFVLSAAHEVSCILASLCAARDRPSTR